MKIDSERLKKIREWQKMSISQLATKALLTPRQIKRLEEGESKNPRETTIVNLSKALEVEQGILTGELPMPEMKKQELCETSIKSQINAIVGARARLSYALIKRRYDVTFTEIMDMAPLFFVLLAEGSLKWRKEKVIKLNEAIGEMEKIAGEGQHLRYAYCAERASDPIFEEKESIENADIFGKKISDEVEYWGGNLSKGNPFADYLRKFSEDIKIPKIVEINSKKIDEYGEEVPVNYPPYIICNNEINKVCGESEDAREALEKGIVKLGEIPEHLGSDDSKVKRIKWLEEKRTEYYKELSSNLPDFDWAEFGKTLENSRESKNDNK